MVNDTIFLGNEANVALGIVNPIILKIIIAALVFFMGFVIGKIVERLVVRFFIMSDFDRIFKKKTGFKFSLSLTVSTIIAYFIYVIAIVMALNRLEIATTIITTIVIVLIVILVLFVIFGLNDIFTNLSAGFIIRIRGIIKPGDYIRLKNMHTEGYIISMNAFSIRLETKKDEIVFIPNMAVFKSEIVKPKKIPK
jgi:small-conductance mechanosensitive channel